MSSSFIISNTNYALKSYARNANLFKLRKIEKLIINLSKIPDNSYGEILLAFRLYKFSIVLFCSRVVINGFAVWNRYSVYK